jgi:hypothetical protein
MPNLGAGVDQHLTPAVTPTWIFTPTSLQANTVRLYNEGSNPVYVGPSGLDQPGGFAIAPGNRPVELQNVTQSLYAVSGVQVGAVAGTVGASAATAGSTAITMATTVPTALAAGTTIVIGSTVNTGWEAQVVNATTASSQLTFAQALVNDHANGVPVYLATARLGQLRVTAGIV